MEAHDLSNGKVCVASLELKLESDCSRLRCTRVHNMRMQVGWFKPQCGHSKTSGKRSIAKGLEVSAIVAVAVVVKHPELGERQRACLRRSPRVRSSRPEIAEIEECS